MDELEWRFTASGGPGGQHANTANTRAEVRFELRDRPEVAWVSTEEIARYARSCVPPGLTALSDLQRLTFDDLLPELSQSDLERRRTAA